MNRQWINPQLLNHPVLSVQYFIHHSAWFCRPDSLPHVGLFFTLVALRRTVWRLASLLTAARVFFLSLNRLCPRESCLKLYWNTATPWASPPSWYAFFLSLSFFLFTLLLRSVHHGRRVSTFWVSMFWFHELAGGAGLTGGGAWITQN